MFVVGFLNTLLEEVTVLRHEKCPLPLFLADGSFLKLFLAIN